MTWLERRKYGGKTPSAFVGMVLGMYVVMFMALFALPIAGEASANLLCEGNFPCFSPAACQKAGGAYAACADKCGNPNRGYCYAQQEPVPLTIRIGSIREVVDLGAYIEAVYTYAIGVAAVIAAVMMMIGGVQWLTAAGDSGRVSSAKGRITNAIIGLLLTVFAWVFLNTINPSLVRLQMPRIPMVKRTDFVRCDEFKLQRACGQPFGLVENEGAADDANDLERYSVVNDPSGVDVMQECVGASCGLAGFEEGSYTCQSASAAASSDAGTTAGTEAATSSESTTGVGAGYVCSPCVTQGNGCTGLGLNSLCCGGYCGATSDSVDDIGSRLAAGTTAATAAETQGLELPGTCSSGMNGVKCGTAAECYGGRCVDVSDYFQALTPVSNLASGIWDVISGIFTLDLSTVLRGQRAITYAPTSGIAGIWAGGICSNGSIGAPCNSSEDCGSGLVCLNDVGVYVCSLPVASSYCSEEGHCGPNLNCDQGIHRCSNQTNEVECTDDRYCQAAYGADYRCRHIAGQQSCTNFENGAMCTDDSLCRSQNCYQGAILDVPSGTNVGICVEGLDGNGCDGNDDCQSQYCMDFEGFGRACIGPNPSGGPCDPEGPDTQCQENLACNDNSHTCLPE